MKQFLLFCGECYYPRGGWEDLEGDYDTIEAAALILEMKAGRARRDDQFEWAQIVDTETMEIAWVGRLWSEHYYYATNPAFHTEGDKFMWWPGTVPEVN